MKEYSKIASERRIVKDLESIIQVIEDNVFISSRIKAIVIKVLWYVVEEIKADLKR